MRGAVLLGLCTTLGLGGIFALDSTAAASRGRTCGPRRAQTVGESATIRFYRVPHRSRYAPELEYACWRSGGSAPLLLGYAGSYGFDAAHTTLVKLADPAGRGPSGVIAWVQRVEGHTSSINVRSGDVRTGRLIHETGPASGGQAIESMTRGYFVVTPTGSLGWWGRGGRVDGQRRFDGPVGIWTIDATGEHLLGTGEWITRPLKWGAGTFYWSIEGHDDATALQ